MVVSEQIYRPGELRVSVAYTGVGPSKKVGVIWYELAQLDKRSEFGEALIYGFGDTKIDDLREGPTVDFGNGIEDAGNVGMVHEREDSPLGLEAGDYLARIHAELDDFEGDLAADGLFGKVNDAHAALARDADGFIWSKLIGCGCESIGGRGLRAQGGRRFARIIQ
jgi:hypothetical protein